MLALFHAGCILDLAGGITRSGNGIQLCKRFDSAGSRSGSWSGLNHRGSQEDDDGVDDCGSRDLHGLNGEVFV